LFEAPDRRATYGHRNTFPGDGQDFNGARRSMNDRTDTAMMASAAAEPAAPAGPAIGAFLGTEETRLRDLLAFGLAAEAGRVGPDGIEGLRRKADADLHAHAFRHLHNEVERIRREAKDEERGRAPRDSGFLRQVLANLVALAAFGLLLLALQAANPGLLPSLAQAIARLAGKG
jgi:hypothetical protein